MRHRFAAALRSDATIAATVAATIVASLAATGSACAQHPLPASPRPGQVVVTGTVPDEASKAAMLQRLRELYGAERVVDQIGIGNVALPPNWSGYVQKPVSYTHLTLPTSDLV